MTDLPLTKLAETATPGGAPNTAFVYFTYWSPQTQNDPNAYPRNVKLRGNTFGAGNHCGISYDVPYEVAPGGRERIWDDKGMFVRA